MGAKHWGMIGLIDSVEVLGVLPDANHSTKHYEQPLGHRRVNSVDAGVAFPCGVKVGWVGLMELHALFQGVPNSSLGRELSLIHI